jgi:hypothetical protein
VLEIGSIVDATILKVSGACIVASHGADEIFIDRTEFFWVWPSGNSCDEIARQAWPVGSSQRVYVMRYLYAWGQVLGSLRRARDEESPYRQLSREAPGSTYDAVVTTPWRTAERSSLVVRMPSGIAAVMTDETVETNGWLKALKVGDAVKVRLDLLDLSEPRLEVRPAT